jgi:hypothetical protein
MRIGQATYVGQLRHLERRQNPTLPGIRLKLDGEWLENIGNKSFPYSTW